MSKKLKTLLAAVSSLGVIGAGAVWVSIHNHSNQEPLSKEPSNQEPTGSATDVLFRRDISGMTIEVLGIREDFQSKLGLNVDAIPEFNVPNRRQEALIQELQRGTWINSKGPGGSAWGTAVFIVIQYENSDQVTISVADVPYDGGTIYKFGLGRNTDTRYDSIFRLNNPKRWLPEFRGRSSVELMKLILDAWQASKNPGETGQ
jgi:hypothetical protein